MIFIGSMKKPIIDEATYTKIALFIDPLINAIGTNKDVRVRILRVLIGNSI